MIMQKNGVKNMINRTKAGAVALGIGLTALLPSTVQADYSPNESTAYTQSNPSTNIANYKEAQRVYGIPSAIGFKKFIKKLPYDKVLEIANSFADTEEGRAGAREFADRYKDEYLDYASDERVYGKENCTPITFKRGPWDITQYEYFASAKQIHEKGKADCEGQFVATAALLRKFYAPLGISVKRELTSFENMIRKSNASAQTLYHIVYGFKENGRWGILGVADVEDKAPEYATLEEAVRTLNDIYIQKGNSYSLNTKKGKNGITNLDDAYPKSKWIYGEGNLSDPNLYVAANKTSQ